MSEAGRVVDSESLRGINTKCSSIVWVWRGVRKERRRLGVRRAGTGEVLSTFALTNENLGGAVRGLNFARVNF